MHFMFFSKLGKRRFLLFVICFLEISQGKEQKRDVATVVRYTLGCRFFSCYRICPIAMNPQPPRLDGLCPRCSCANVSPIFVAGR